MDIRKRGRNEGNINGGQKRSRQEMESIGVGSKSKPCTKFFSTAGCPFGESCHFAHFVPGGYHAVAQMVNLPSPVPPPPRNMPPPPVQNGSGPISVKSRMCKKYNSMEGCKFGDKCNFAHGEWELNKPVGPPSYDSMGHFSHMPGQHHHMPGRMLEPPGHAAAGFGASATAKISVDSSLAGAIIGKGGVHSKQICRETGVKLSIRDIEADPKLKNIELEGTIDQIHQASAMVRELIGNLGHAGTGGGAGGGGGRSHGPPGGGAGGGGGRSHGPPGGGAGRSGTNFKTKLCENFTKGSCTFGDRCHFAHGANEMRKTAL